MSRPILSDLDFGSVAKIVNLIDPTAAQHAATKAYVDSAVEGLAWKDSCCVATQANLNLAAPGATIDGITMATNDRILVKAQTAGADNGIYIWNGAATPATRSLDCSTAAELEQAVTTVEEGTSAGASFRQTVVNLTLGTTTVTWASFGTGAPAASETTAGIAEIATQAETDTGTDDLRFVTPAKLAAYSGRKLKHVATFGDGAATQYDFTHNFGTRDVTAHVYRNSGSFDDVMCDISRPDANTVRVNTAAAVASNALRIVIIG